MALFKNRYEAGLKVGEIIAPLGKEIRNPIVLGIPRGGIPVGMAVAEQLNCPLDTIGLRKLPIPFDPEAGFGAVTLDRITVFNQPLLDRLQLSQQQVNSVVDSVYREVIRRNEEYRQGRPFPSLRDHTVIICDDGLASGYTMLAAIEYARHKGAGQIIAAAPVAHDSAYEAVKQKADRVAVVYVTATTLFAVASHYDSFPEMSDEEVLAYLRRRPAPALSR
jgi:putative phosphoribosyl transferase